ARLKLLGTGPPGRERSRRGIGHGPQDKCPLGGEQGITRHGTGANRAWRWCTLAGPAPKADEWAVVVPGQVAGADAVVPGAGRSAVSVWLAGVGRFRDHRPEGYRLR